jgi:two-component system, LuxR family, response regulator FixJ
MSGGNEVREYPKVLLFWRERTGGSLSRHDGCDGRLNIMVALASPPLFWNLMAPTTEPVVFIVGETEATRPWSGLLKVHKLESRTVRSVIDFPREDGSPGCVLLVLTSDRELDGLQVCARWLALGDERPLIVLASSPELVRLLKRLSAGRLEVFEATESADTILVRIRSAVAGDVERRRRHAAWSEIAARFSMLTVKDREVLDLLLNGLPNKSIAQRLSVTERAIEMRRASLMKKLQARSHAQLIRLVTRYEVFAGFGLPLPIE